MKNLNLPLPMVIAGGAMLLAGGYVVGLALGGDEPTETTAQVESYTNGTDKLCLEGKSVEGFDGTKDGVLCGTWRHDSGARRPKAGEDFRFVVITSEGAKADESATYIYGNVLR